MSAGPLAAALADLALGRAGARPEAAPADAHALWRYELERAQWKLHADAQRAAGDAPRPDSASAAAPRTPLRLQPQGLPVAPGAGRAPSAQADGASAQARAQAEAGRGAPAQPAAEPRPAVGAGVLRQPLLQAARQAPPQAAAARPQPRIPWPEVNAHVVVEGNRVKAWIRDASLDESERKDLLAQLRVRLRGAGLELETLTVNGREEPTSS